MITLLPKTLKTIRKINNFSQKRLGELIGVTAQQIQKYESGKNTPPIDKLYKIAKVFNIGIADLLKTEEDFGDNSVSYIKKGNLIVKNKDNLPYLTEISKYLDRVDSIALKDKILDLISIMSE